MQNDDVRWCQIVEKATSLTRGFGDARTAANGSARHSPVISVKVVLGVDKATHGG
jgi:hypothetical protein